jgi:hypothetical protein
MAFRAPDVTLLKLLVINDWLPDGELLASKHSKLVLTGVLSIRALVFLHKYVCNGATYPNICLITTPTLKHVYRILTSTHDLVDIQILAKARTRSWRCTRG